MEPIITEDASRAVFLRWTAAFAICLLASAALLWARFGPAIFFDALAAVQSCF